MTPGRIKDENKGFYEQMGAKQHVSKGITLGQPMRVLFNEVHMKTLVAKHCTSNPIGF